ncbi:YitT family protein [Proteiniborus sp. MB09-C3]|uniref:YitT family protein n=1 Tax=Proteiniborus sp. MB09-C3 TaxID=3050072 RepID=UPI00255752A0|nr:YitT family protein [Proteiniborus sp. MB09-C3]WIV13466.1 YitT family protein [Proteiniborus sp. MB09-C3]
MEKTKKYWYRHFIEYAGVTLGTFIMALAINFFLEPNTIAPGGVTGLGIILQKLTNGLITVWATNLIVNIPLFIAGVMILGKSFGAKTLYGTFVLSFFLWIVPQTSATHDLLLSSVFGGVILGVGLGIVFKAGGTTGGTDLAGAIMNRFFPGLSTATHMMIVDMIVVASSGILNKRIDIPLYSVIALYILVRVIDIILEGFSYDKAFFIISNEPEKIGKTILEELDRGVTILKGKGLYSGLEKDVLLCVVNRAQMAKVKEIISSVDKRAFIMITDMHEVIGEGFKEIKTE